MTGKLNLTRAQKAAAILVAMGKPAAGRLLKFFKQEELKTLVEAARELRTIPQAELNRIVGEFEAEFAEGAGLLDSADKMNMLLNESLSPEELGLLMGQNVPRVDSQSTVWGDMERLDPQRLADLLSNEHPQTIAYVLSNLSPEPAARILVTLEKPIRTEVLRRLISTSQIKPKAKQIVERQLRNLLQAEASGKDVSAGQAKVASLLNELDKTQIDEVMRDLEESGTSDVASIRAQIFSFEEIPLLPHKARVALFDGFDTDVVTLALRGAASELKEAVLSALGPRSRRMIESELSINVDGLQAEEVTRARKRIASAAIQLARRGVFVLPSAQKQEEAA
ncbi:MAG TPA: flagellar motor switch protein FliG [Hyphomicrobiaceae bacterium]